MSEQVKDNSLTVTMTGRRPVKIQKDEWDLILFHKGWEGEYESQAFRNWWLRIRRKKSTNTFLVSAGYDTQWQGEKDHRAGVLVDNPTNLEQTIEEVCREIGVRETFVQECIDKLPAEEI